VTPITSQGIQSWNRYEYGFNNPLRYSDPTGLFDEDQLKEWYGEDWKKTITEEYSEEMVVLLTQADFGDMVTYKKNGVTFGATFVSGKNGELEMWDLGTKSTTSLGNIDKNSISGYYKRKSGSDTEYSLDTAFSTDAQKNITLPGNWRYGDKERVSQGLTSRGGPPSVLGTVALVAGIAGLTFPPAEGLIGAFQICVGVVGISAGAMDIVKMESFDQSGIYPSMPHNPIPGQANNSSEYLGPQIQGTPSPPVPLY
jgi:hypothetical protein